MQGVLCYNCQNYRHIAKYCTQRKKQGQSSQARAARPAKESDDDAKEQANVLLQKMGEESEKVKEYIVKTVWKREDFQGA